MRLSRGRARLTVQKNQLCADMEFQIEAWNALLLLYLQELLEGMSKGENACLK
jgi:hypothetical protein